MFAKELAENEKAMARAAQRRLQLRTNLKRAQGKLAHQMHFRAVLDSDRAPSPPPPEGAGDPSGGPTP